MRYVTHIFATFTRQDAPASSVLHAAEICALAHITRKRFKSIVLKWRKAVRVSSSTWCGETSLDTLLLLRRCMRSFTLRLELSHCVETLLQTGLLDTVPSQALPPVCSLLGPRAAGCLGQRPCSRSSNRELFSLVILTDTASYSPQQYR